LKEKILILIVDRDADIEEATGLRTPVYGEENVLRAGEVFAIEKPEDSDVNVIFGGLNLYRKLKGEGHNVEIAIVSGDKSDPVKADLKIKKELDELKKKIGFNAVIIVSDGAEDEAVIPIVQGVAPVVSVRRIIVEQWRGVEETYILIGRYIKKALVEPRFSRLFLGVPGLIVLFLAILKITGYLNYAAAIAGLVIGAAMVIRGFNLEEKLHEYWASSPIMFISSTVSTILLTTALALFFYTIKNQGTTLSSLGSAISGSTPFFGMSVFSILVGKSVVKLIERNLKVWHDIVGMVVTIVTVIAFERLGEALYLMPVEAGATGLEQALLESGFVEILLIGMGIAGALTVIAGILERKYHRNMH